ncbi:Swt1 family HEPN domain-containing protein [Salinisphaera sp. T31B1]|uniref:Swt1 family HEPN domain-containing protein n=1 Tax=Salinisphaera sp. T31B1 TaxID=727963 RepID=UPI0033425B90
MQPVDRENSLERFLARMESAIVDDATARLLEDLDDLEAYARRPEAVIDLVPTARGRLIKHLGSRRRANTSGRKCVSSDPVMTVVNRLDAMAGQPVQQSRAQVSTADQVKRLLSDLYSKVIQDHDFGETDSFTDLSNTFPVSNEPDGDYLNAIVRVRDFERTMRDLIDSELTRLYGPDREEEQPRLRNLYRKWRKKLDREIHRDSSSSKRLIDYSNFSQLGDLIVDDELWAECFSAYFASKASVKEAFRHLTPIRNILAHSRDITRKQALRAHFETQRLLRKIDSRRLH